MDIKIEKKKGLTRKQILIGAIAIAVVGLMAWAWTNGSADSMSVRRSSLNIATATEGEFNDFVRVNGQVAPIQVVQISPEEGGIVRERVVEEGAKVQMGDVIVRLSNSNLELQILNAEAELAEKQNLLRNTQVQMQQDKLSNEQDRLQLAMDTERKQRTAGQYERLYSEKLISREKFLEAKEDFELAKRKLALVTERLRQDSIYRKVQMDQMEENLANMRRNVILIRERKAKLDVRAPIGGELGLLDVELGQNVPAGTLVGQINDLNDYKVIASIDEHYVDRVMSGQPAMLDRQDDKFALRVRKVYPEIREGRFRTELVFEGGHPESIRTGQTFYIDLQLGEPSKAIMVPKGAFFQSTAGQWIFVLSADGSKAYKRKIRIGRQNPQMYEVLEGIEAGEKVVTSGYETFGNKEELNITD
ncbi:MAG: efflux RND transporter periplasmic adaptor subunit [Bacteroidales bacterium]|nr:efflux RND transporter periplasmic adaptor subunit [Bacteroidales bacterium]MDY4174135.1 efflux RND transporter periplasmic adaptor subunit [Bacteroidales bacterium]